MPRTSPLIVVLAGLLTAGAPAGQAASGQEGRPRHPAPELDGAEAWVTANQTEGPQPLRISELKGKVVLLDFWTYG